MPISNVDCYLNSVQCQTVFRKLKVFDAAVIAKFVPARTSPIAG